MRHINILREFPAIEFNGKTYALTEQLPYWERMGDVVMRMTHLGPYEGTIYEAEPRHKTAQVYIDDRSSGEMFVAAVGYQSQVINLMFRMEAV